jgi:hypothetical protein
MKKLVLSLSVVLMMVGCTSQDGENGIDGKDGVGKDGLNGVNGTNGINGKDGKNGSNFVYTTETIKKDTVIGGVVNKMETLQLSSTTTIKSILPVKLTGKSRIGLSGMSIMIKNAVTTGKGNRDCKLIMYNNATSFSRILVKTKIVNDYVTVENKDIDNLLTSREVDLELGEGMEKTGLSFDDYEQGLIHAFLVRMEYKNTNINIDSFIGNWTNGIDTLNVGNKGFLSVRNVKSPDVNFVSSSWWFDFANDLNIKDRLDEFKDMDYYEYNDFGPKFEVASKMKIVSVDANKLVLEHKQTIANAKQYITLYSGAKVEVVYSNSRYTKLDGTILREYYNDSDFVNNSALPGSTDNSGNCYPFRVKINGVEKSNRHYEYIRNAEQVGVYNGTWAKIVE